MPEVAGSGGLRIAPVTFGAMLCLVVVWGLSIPVTKLALDTMPPMTLTAMRFAFAVPALFLLGWGRLRVPMSVLPRLAMLGLLGIGIGQVAQNFGIQATSASVSTIISAMIPVFIIIFAAMRLAQPVPKIQIVGLLAAFAGIAVVAFSQSGGPQATSLWGAGLVLLSAVAVAVYYVWSVELTARHGVLSVAAWSTLAGFMVLLPFSAVEILDTPLSVGMGNLAAAAYLGLFVSAGGLFLWIWLVQHVPARTAASVQFMQPIVGIAASAAMFGDPVSGMFAEGALLVVGGIGFSVLADRT